MSRPNTPPFTPFRPLRIYSDSPFSDYSSPGHGFQTAANDAQKKLLERVNHVAAQVLRNNPTADMLPSLFKTLAQIENELLARKSTELDDSGLFLDDDDDEDGSRRSDPLEDNPDLRKYYLSTGRSAIELRKRFEEVKNINALTLERMHVMSKACSELRAKLVSLQKEKEQEVAGLTARIEELETGKKPSTPYKPDYTLDEIVEIVSEHITDFSPDPTTKDVKELVALLKSRIVYEGPHDGAVSGDEIYILVAQPWSPKPLKDLLTAALSCNSHVWKLDVMTHSPFEGPAIWFAGASRSHLLSFLDSRIVKGMVEIDHIPAKLRVQLLKCIMASP